MAPAQKVFRLLTVIIPEDAVSTEVPGNGCHNEEARGWLPVPFSSSGKVTRCANS
jgi:hypothetical protein